MKTSELTGVTLNWAVAKCEDRTIITFLGGGILVNGRTDLGEELDVAQGFNYMWHPSTNWAQGGPIIEREKIQLWYCTDKWQAEKKHFGRHHAAGRTLTEGLTPLVAAMRCHVTSKLGDEVEVPKELI